MFQPDTLAVVVDTAVVAVDTTKAVVDSITQGGAVQVTAQLTGIAAIGLGFVVKLVMDLAKRLLDKFNAAPSRVKAVVALVFGQLATWVSVWTGLAINPDIQALDATIAGLVVSGLAMGINALLKSFGLAVPKKPVE